MLREKPGHDRLLPHKNKQRTLTAAGTQGNTWPAVAANQNVARPRRCCACVLPEGGCAAPAAAGSAYCGWHRSLCEPPEPIEEDDAERLAGLDLPLPGPRHDE